MKTIRLMNNQELRDYRKELFHRTVRLKCHGGWNDTIDPIRRRKERLAIRCLAAVEVEIASRGHEV